MSDVALSRLVSDKDISTRLYLQLCDLKDAILIDERRKGDLFRCVVEIMRKLETVKYHRDNLLKRVSEEMRVRGGTRNEEICYIVDLTTGVEKEFEAFLMQGKACLDVLVKILQPLFQVKLHSYGHGGTKVIKALRKNLPPAELQLAENLICLIENDREWIGKWFKDERDTVTHYRAIVSSGFVTTPRSAEGESRHLGPALMDGTPFCQAVSVLYHNLLTFCEDFIPLAVSVNFPKGILLRLIPEGERDAEYPRKYGMVLNRAEVTPGTGAT